MIFSPHIVTQQRRQREIEACSINKTRAADAVAPKQFLDIYCSLFAVFPVNHIRNVEMADFKMFL